jgi:hypothetical protein
MAFQPLIMPGFRRKPPFPCLLIICQPSGWHNYPELCEAVRPKQSEGRTVAKCRTGAKAPWPSAILHFAHRPVIRRSIRRVRGRPAPSAAMIRCKPQFTLHFLAEPLIVCRHKSPCGPVADPVAGSAWGPQNRGRRAEIYRPFYCLVEGRAAALDAWAAHVAAIEQNNVISLRSAHYKAEINGMPDRQ